MIVTLLGGPFDGEEVELLPETSTFQRDANGQTHHYVRRPSDATQARYLGSHDDGATMELHLRAAESEVFKLREELREARSVAAAWRDDCRRQLDQFKLGVGEDVEEFNARNPFPWEQTD